MKKCSYLLKNRITTSCNVLFYADNCIFICLKDVLIVLYDVLFYATVLHEIYEKAGFTN